VLVFVLNPRSIRLGMVKKLTKAKVCVFACPLDIAQTETKGTVLLKNAEEMLNFTRGEEQHLEIVISISLCFGDITHPKS
jgi:chaperonin GroEL (HSP60 family)